MLLLFLSFTGPGRMGHPEQDGGLMGPTGVSPAVGVFGQGQGLLNRVPETLTPSVPHRGGLRRNTLGRGTLGTFLAPEAPPRCPSPVQVESPGRRVGVTTGPLPPVKYGGVVEVVTRRVSSLP